MDYNIGWPEGIVIFWLCLMLMMAAVSHGKPFKYPVSFHVQFCKVIFWALLLIFGGFFS